MKSKYILKKYHIFLYMLFLLFQIGCDGKATEQQKIDTVVSEIKIGLTVYRRDDTFIAMIVSDMEEAVKEAEQKNNIKIVMNTMDAKGSQIVQNDHIDKLIEQGCDVLCVNLVDRTVAATVIDKAKAADIPVVFFNREPVKEDLERWNKVYYVGADASESGKLEGQIVVEQYNKNNNIDKNRDGKLQYVVLEGEQGHQDALLRTEYAVKTITEAGIQMDKLAGDTANWLRSQAETKMNQWLQIYDDEIELVLCNNDDMALGAIDAYENIDKTLPAIVGIDGIAPAIEAMQQGKLLETVKNDAEMQSELIFELSYRLAMKEDISKSMNLVRGKYIFTRYTILKPNNDILNEQ